MVIETTMAQLKIGDDVKKTPLKLNFSLKCKSNGRISCPHLW